MQLRENSLNPCCAGRDTLTISVCVRKGRNRQGLNPCCAGRDTLTTTNHYCPKNRGKVLILVVLDVIL